MYCYGYSYFGRESLSLSFVILVAVARLESVGCVDELGQPTMALRERESSNVDVHATVPLLVTEQATPIES
jgi:hypothetical protein